MKALNPFSESVPLLFLLLVMMTTMATTVEVSYSVEETNADPDIPPNENNGTLYYIREDGFTDVKTALKNCAADGGKLLEIDSESEFNFVQDYLRSIKEQGIIFTYIGGQYQLDDSQWIFPTAGSPVPFFQPSSNLANFDPRWGVFCLALRYESETDRYSMHPASCIIEGLCPHRYLCEKIQLPKGVPDLFGVTNADPDIPSFEYNGRLYYVREDKFTDEELARNNCAADSGHLVELGDWAEFNAIENYLKTMENQNVDFLYIGGKYESDVSQWIYPTGGTPVPFIHPTYYLQNYDPRWDSRCLAIRYDVQMNWYSMNIAPCITEGLTWERYMCEKIYAPYSHAQLPNADPNNPAIEFRNKIYYFHKKRFSSSYEDNLEDCKADGGMMAEINDWVEFLVVQKYVESAVTDYARVFIGGKKTINGWVLPSTNQSLPYTNWGYNEPYDYESLCNCLTLHLYNGWKMASFFCDNTYTDRAWRVLCEKPKDS